MYGSAMLAIVVSSACMTVARITHTVIAAGFVPGIDIDLDAHPRAQRWPVLVAGVEANAHRDTLHDFHPVAARVLRRQEREFLRRGRADALNGPVPFRIRIRVHRHRDRLSG